MPTVNDDKLSALLFANGNPSGSIPDEWDEWLRSQIVGSLTGKEDINDLENLFLDEAGISAGSQNDRWSAWLIVQGHTQSALSDQWASYWDAVAP